LLDFRSASVSEGEYVIESAAPPVSVFARIASDAARRTDGESAGVVAATSWLT
jgi:hypothetical protein